MLVVFQYSQQNKNHVLLVNEVPASGCSTRLDDILHTEKGAARQSAIHILKSFGMFVYIQKHNMDKSVAV